MEGFFGIIVFIGVIVSVILRAGGKAANTDSKGQRKPGLGESILRAMELEQEAKTVQQSTRQQTAAVPEKPVIQHSTDNCTGGSIHDGYHEGTVRRPAPASSAEGKTGTQGARRTSYAPGRTGQGMQASEGSGHISGLPSREELMREIQSKLAYEKASASHAVGGAQAQPAQKPAPAAPQKSGLEKLTEAIASKPPMVQGIMWAEILGRPLSDS